MQITIFASKAGKTCSANCGTDWSAREILDAVRQQAREKFSRAIDIAYLDLSQINDSDIREKLKELESGLSTTALLVNNRPRIIGDFDVRQLMDVIEVELEAGIK